MATIADFNALAAYQAAAPAVPYVYGGTSLKGAPHPGVDCSGMPFAIGQHFGVSIPRTTEAEWAALPRISASELRAGDLIEYNVPGEPNPPNHVVIYWNQNLVLEAPHTGENVKFSAPLPYPIVGYVRLPFADSPAVTPTPPPAPVSEPTIQEGSTGPAVVKAQQLISAKFNHPLTADGSFGPLTKAAVEDIQKFFDVTVDGIVGPQTWSILINL